MRVSMDCVHGEFSRSTCWICKNKLHIYGLSSTNRQGLTFAWFKRKSHIFSPFFYFCNQFLMFVFVIRNNVKIICEWCSDDFCHFCFSFSLILDDIPLGFFKLLYVFNKWIKSNQEDYARIWVSLEGTFKEFYDISFPV